MPVENYNKYAVPVENFIAGVVLDRAKRKYPDDDIKVRMATKGLYGEDSELKCDFFLVKNGVDYMAYDAKSPTGISGKNIDLNKYWFCPYDYNGDEKDISLVVKTKIKTVKNRYIAFLGKDVVFFATSEQLADWAVKNRYPDFREWKNGNKDKFLKLPRGGSDNFWIQRQQNGYEKILTLLTAEELESISHSKINLTNDESYEMSYVIESMRTGR